MTHPYLKYMNETVEERFARIGRWREQLIAGPGDDLEALRAEEVAREAEDDLITIGELLAQPGPQPAPTTA